MITYESSEQLENTANRWYETIRGRGRKMPGTAVTSLAAARHMCERSGWSLTNLQLQKMLYCAQLLYLGQTGERLFNGIFEAWDYGPVLPDVYSRVKMYGRGPILGGFFGVGSVSDPDRAQKLDEAVDQLGRVSAGKLVSITHWPEGAWAKNYVANVKDIIIPDSDIIDEYRQRAARKHS